MCKSIVRVQWDDLSEGFLRFSRWWRLRCVQRGHGFEPRADLLHLVKIARQVPRHQPMIWILTACLYCLSPICGWMTSEAVGP